VWYVLQEMRLARDAGWYPGNYNDAADTRDRYLGSLSNGYRRILAGFEKDVRMSRSGRRCCSARIRMACFAGLECRMDGRLEVIEADQSVGRRTVRRGVLNAVGLAGSGMFTVGAGGNRVR
jgi:hypothetical protein